MPLVKNLVEGNSDVFLKSLALSLPLVTFLLPLTGLSAGATILLYLFFQYEHVFNSTLVRCTPPPPDAHIPSYEEWIENGGMKRLSHFTPANNEDYCIICRNLPTDPNQLTPCGHIFCAECVGAWHAQGYRSCPQCTIPLWRGAPIDYSQLERLIKFTAAAGLVAAPMTVFALCCCFAHVFNNEAGFGIAQAVPLVSFTALSALVLLLMWGGLSIMLEQRRTQGIKWWGKCIDSELELALRMSMAGFSLAAGCWLLLVCVICEAYIGRFTPVWKFLQVVIEALGWRSLS